MFLKSIALPNTVLLFLLAIAIQVQLLFGMSETYMGIRINIGDFIIPFAGLFVLKTLIVKQAKWPKWQAPCKDVWFYALIGIVLLGLGNAYLKYGEISSWALLNRGGGWVVLTGYVYFFAWSITNFGEKALALYLRTFLLFACTTMIMGTIWFFITQYGTKQSGNLNYQAFSGFMGNRNAFSFLMISAIILYTYIDSATANNTFFIRKAQPVLTYAVWFLLPFAMMFNGSRAGWMALVVIIVWFLCVKLKYTARYILPACTIALITIGGVYTQNPESVFRENQGEKIATLGAGEIVHKTDHLRLTVFEDAMELWSDNKIFGAGVGGFLKYQEEKHGKVLDQIDNSALWILTELGIFGAIAFGAFYIVTFIALWKKYKETEGLQSTFAQAMMVIMVFFALYSLVHQILYARYLWVFLGLALATPYKQTKTQ